MNIQTFGGSYAPRVPILVYHGIEAAEGSGPPHPRWDSAYAVTTGAFTAQLAWLAAGGPNVARLEDVARGGAGRDGWRVVLTFDDGYESDVALALPALQAHGFTATFFVETGSVGEAGRLGRAQVRALAGAGMTIGSHTVSHRFLTDLPGEEVRRELADSREFLEDLIGAPVRFVSAPGGRCDRRTAAIAQKCGYEAVCTSVPGGNDPRRPGPLLRRLFVRRSTGQADFRQLVRLGPWRLAREQLHFWTLRGLKRALGNGRYENVRAAILGLKPHRRKAPAHG